MESINTGHYKNNLLLYNRWTVHIILMIKYHL